MVSQNRKILTIFGDRFVHILLFAPVLFLFVLSSMTYAEDEIHLVGSDGKEIMFPSFLKKLSPFLGIALEGSFQEAETKQIQFKEIDSKTLTYLKMLVDILPKCISAQIPNWDEINEGTVFNDTVINKEAENIMKGVGKSLLFKCLEASWYLDSKPLINAFVHLIGIHIERFFHKNGKTKDIQKNFKEIIAHIERCPQDIQHEVLREITPIHQFSTFLLKQKKEISSETLTGHKVWVRSVAFSPDGIKLATGSDDKTIKIWDVKTGNALQILTGHIDWVKSVAFSPDGTKLASGSHDKTIKIWDVKKGIVLQTLTGHTNRMYSVAFSPDGTKLALGSHDKTIKIWDIRTGNDLQTLIGHKDSVNSVAFSPDGTKLASGSDDKTIKIWGMKTGNALQTLTGHTDWVRSVAYSPDGTKLASGSNDETIKIWDVKKGNPLQALTGRNGRVYSVAYSPDGTKLASGSDDKTIKIWEVKTGNVLQTLTGHKTWVWSVAFSPDGTKLASGSSDTTIKIWDVYTEEEQRILREIELNITPSQRLLLYILDKRPGKSLSVIEEELKSCYNQNTPLLLDVRGSYKGLPPEVKKWIQIVE